MRKWDGFFLSLFKPSFPALTVVSPGNLLKMGWCFSSSSFFKSVGSVIAQHLAGFSHISPVPTHRFHTGMVPFTHTNCPLSALEPATSTASPWVMRTCPCCSSPHSNQFSSHLLGHAESWPAAPHASWPVMPLSHANAGAAAAAPPPAAPGAS